MIPDRLVLSGVFQKKVLTSLKLYSKIIKSVATNNHGILAQLGEHLPYKQRVTGSSPVGPIPVYRRRY